ncbi:MAG: NAD(P)H-dependent glycerol-3-phosphate dehydrogenase [Gammaproteobacteria bacterium]
MSAGAPLAVLGAGAWGTALAIVIARTGQTVYLWGRNTAHLIEMKTSRENTRYLAGLTFPPALIPLPHLGALPALTRTAVIATPLQATRATVRLALANGLDAFICAAKGIERDTQQLAHEIVLQEAGSTTAVALISGPNFAREVAEGRPAALAVAARDDRFGNALVARLHGPTLRPYRTDDLTGVAVGGAVKNVLAIAAGIGDGLNLGANSRAALITRGLHEMARFGIALGGRMETFMGLAGLGDLVLTSTDDHSRNRRYGLALGRGVEREIAGELGLVEGIPTAAAVIGRAIAAQIEMPICAQVARTISGECTPLEAVRTLMARELPALMT